MSLNVMKGHILPNTQTKRADIAARLRRDVCCSYDMLVIGQCSVDPLGAMFHVIVRYAH
jgi:hypothetical protein